MAPCFKDWDSPWYTQRRAGRRWLTRGVAAQVWLFMSGCCSLSTLTEVFNPQNQWWFNKLNNNNNNNNFRWILLDVKLVLHDGWPGPPVTKVEFPLRRATKSRSNNPQQVCVGLIGCTKTHPEWAHTGSPSQVKPILNKCTHTASSDRPPSLSSESRIPQSLRFSHAAKTGKK